MLIPTIIHHQALLPRHLIALPISTLAISVNQVAVEVAKLPMLWLWIITAVSQSLEDNSPYAMLFPKFYNILSQSHMLRKHLFHKSSLCIPLHQSRAIRKASTISILLLQQFQSLIRQPTHSLLLCKNQDIPPIHVIINLLHISVYSNIKQSQ